MLRFRPFLMQKPTKLPVISVLSVQEAAWNHSVSPAEHGIVPEAAAHAAIWNHCCVGPTDGFHFL